ncbi:sensor histidine kinase [Sinosporangium siamense]|uniref:sensor histidine kinase n=1 Tax=Sinosporangium siamense TaxID=1367973 RepID=UPI001EF32315|nr:HAMP domain-containing sensor histidine kinase [Sinosporangium siamense]
MDGARRWIQRAPLWLRLVLGTSLLVTLALVLMGVSAVQLLRGYMQDRIDEQLTSITRAPPQLAEGSQPHSDEAAGVVAALQGDGDLGARMRLRPFRVFGMVYAITVRPDGRHLRVIVAPPDAVRPKLPPLTATDVVKRGPQPFTVGSTTPNGPDWRVVVALARNGNARVVAISMGEQIETVRQLVHFIGLTGLAVVIVMATACYMLVRRSLRPLIAIKRSTMAIAAGDLSRRVPVPPGGSEIGRLGEAINDMLAQLERAFLDRQASEAAAQEAARAAEKSAKAASESADSAKDSEDRMRRFVADASHELRTPLTSIRGFAELYRHQDAGRDVEAARLLRRIEDEATRMGLLVDDLLLLARLDRQRPLTTAPVDMLSLAAGAVLDARILAPERDVDLVRLDAAEVPVMVSGDETRLRQVVGNLVDNALRHTPKGTPFQVGVGVEGDEVVLEVVDQGPGFGALDPEWVFERFYRADPSRTRGMGGGSGLGLSIVAALVKAHGGTVTAERAPGGGALFRVRLPGERSL